MNKAQIILAVSHANVPPGTLLVKETNPALPGLEVVKVERGNTGSLKMVMAGIYEQELAECTAGLGESPDATLLARIHKSAFNFSVLMHDGEAIEAVQEEMVLEYRTMIEKLREIARQLGITYENPDDSRFWA